MPVDTLTKTVGSLGPVKTDTKAYTRTTSELAAAEIEAIKDALIDHADAINTLETAAGEILWEWNKTDVSQFDTNLSYDDTVATAQSGSAALSFVAAASGYRNTPLIRLTADGLRGGLVFPLKTSEITLPERYQIEVVCTYAFSGDGPGMGAVVAPFGAAASTEWRGALVRTLSEQSGIDSALTTDNDPTSGLTLRDSGIGNVDASTDTFNVNAFNRGGRRLLIDVWRAKATDTDFLIAYRVEDPASTDRGSLCEDDLSGAAVVSTDWVDVDFNRVGLGIDGDSASYSGVIDFSEFRIRAHPVDR